MKHTATYTLLDLLSYEELKQMIDMLNSIIKLPVGITNSIEEISSPIGIGQMSSFCEKARKISDRIPICHMSDSYAAMEANYTKKPYLYVCPMGAIDCIAPIFLKGNIIATLKIGQLLSDPEFMDTLPHIPLSPRCTDMAKENIEKLKKKYIHTLSYIPHDKLLSNIKIIEMFILYLESRLENSLKEIQIGQLSNELYHSNKQLHFAKQAEHNAYLHLLRNINFNNVYKEELAYANDLALLEDAEQTSDAIIHLANLLDSSYDYANNQMPLKYEIENFKILFRAYTLINLRLTFEMNCSIDTNMKEMLIPNSIFIFLFKTYMGERFFDTSQMYRIVIDVLQESSDKLIFSIKDNGPQIDRRFLYFAEDNITPELPIPFAFHIIKQRLTQFYGNEHVSINLSTSVDRETITRIQIECQELYS